MILTPRLGRLKGTPDPRTIQLARYLLRAALAAPPGVIDWHSLVRALGVMLNDRYGCCTISALGHLIQAFSVYGTGTQITIPDSIIGSFYFGLSGGADNGLNMLDVCRAVKKTGIGGELVTGYAQFDPADRALLDLATYYFGGSYVGVTLPYNFSSDPSQVWDAGPRTPLDPSAGHAMAMLGSDATYDYYATWGYIQRATKAWTARCADEAYVMVSPRWTARNVAPSGIDYAGLYAEIASLGGDPGPAPQPQPQPPPVPSDGGWGDII